MLKRLAAGIALSGSIVFVTMIGQVLAVPIYLTSWGTQLYGEWLTLTNLVSSISILNLGVQSYVSNRLISCYVQRNFTEGTRILHAALRLYAVLCGLAVLAISLLCFWPGLLVSLGVKEIDSSSARVIISLQGLLGAYAIVGGLLLSLFRVTNQLPRQLAYSLVERIFFIGAPCLVAILGGGPARAVVVTAFVIAILSVVELRDVSHRSPFPIGVAGSTWGAAFSLLGPSFLFLAVSLSAQLLSTGIVLIVSSSSGARTVALFSTTLMLTNFGRIAINQGMTVLWPEITGAAALEDGHKRLVRWHRLTWKLAMQFGLMTGAIISLIGTDVLSIWTRGRLSPDVYLNSLLSLYLVIHAPGLVSGIFGLAMNRQYGVFKVQILTAVISVLFAAGLVPHWGGIGAAVALTVGQIGGTVFMTKSVCGWIGDRLSAMMDQSLLRTVPSVILVLASLLGSRYFLAGSLLRAGIATGLMPLLLAVGWYTCLTQDEREFVRLRIHFRKSNAAVAL